MALEEASVRGVAVHYGQREPDAKLGGNTAQKGLIQSLALTFDFDDLPSNSFASMAAQLPANSTVISATLEIIAAFTSTSTTTDLDVGIADADGGATITDPNGLITATEATQATIAVVGDVITGAGALVGSTIGAEAAVVTVTPNVDDLLTGKGRIIVEYLQRGV